MVIIGSGNEGGKQLAPDGGQESQRWKVKKETNPTVPQGSRHLSVSVVASGDIWQLHTMPTCECAGNEERASDSLDNVTFWKISHMCVCGGEAVEWRGTLSLRSPDGHQHARLERGSPISPTVWCSGDSALGSAAFHTTCCWACLYHHHAQSDNTLSRPRPKQQDKALRFRNRNASLSCLKSPTPENG